MKGKTLYIAYTDRKSLLGEVQGFFDILETAIRGKVYKQFVIPGVYVDMKTLSQIYGNNYLVVTDNKKDIAVPARWQVTTMELIGTISKLSMADLRVYIYLLMTSSANFNKRLAYLWSDSSVTKEKVMNYCRIISGYETCPFLVSRREVSDIFK